MQDIAPKRATVQFLRRDLANLNVLQFCRRRHDPIHLSTGSFRPCCHTLISREAKNACDESRASPNTGRLVLNLLVLDLPVEKVACVSLSFKFFVCLTCRSLDVIGRRLSLHYVTQSFLASF